MAKIKKLIQHQIEQIAAGEVITRPSAAIKELVENAIDADATEIIIEIKDAGLDWFRITDNGSGIDPEDFNLIFERHATSKIDSEKFLDGISTLGFRGEALASIKAVSDISLVTKTARGISAHQITIQASDSEMKIEAYAAPVGTSITVENLFKTMPVRKKFIQSERNETGENTKIVRKLALSHPEISFVLKHQNKLIFKTPGKNNILNTIYEIYGRGYTQQLMPIHWQNEHLEINGYISDIHSMRGSRAYQYLFVNNRVVSIPSVVNIIENIYRRLVTEKTFPMLFLYLHIPPEFLDVNIHPQKTTVLMDKALGIENIFEQLVENALRSSKNKNKIYNDVSNRPASAAEVPWLSKEIRSFSNQQFNEKPLENETPLEDVRMQDFGMGFQDVVHISYEGEENLELSPQEDVLINEVQASFIPDEKEKTFYSSLKLIGIFANRYIILEHIKRETLFLLDQHAAHEKILYEKIINQEDARIFDAQYLLRPEVFSTDSLDGFHMDVFSENVKKLGFILEPFEENTIVLRGVPALIRGDNMRQQFQVILDDPASWNSFELMREKFAKIACTNAIKSGDTLKSEEIFEMLKNLDACDVPNVCPHGRPTVVEISRAEIDKLFKRI